MAKKKPKRDWIVLLHTGEGEKIVRRGYLMETPKEKEAFVDLLSSPLCAAQVPLWTLAPEEKERLERLMEDPDPLTRKLLGQLVRMGYIYGLAANTLQLGD